MNPTSLGTISHALKILYVDYNSITIIVGVAQLATRVVSTVQSPLSRSQGFPKMEGLQ